MLLETLVLLMTAAAPARPPTVLVAPAALFWRTPAPAYLPEKRAVDNWRIESALWLDMRPAEAAKRALGAQDDDPARCVKLNNYWCVKRAGWNGEIASDADGHVAFASAEEGAAVAALLLRRYYVDYRRHSARAIVERWAPAQCTPMAARATIGSPASREGLAQMMPQRAVPMGLAPRGLQNTLRARWLAAHGRGGVGPAPSGGKLPQTPDLIPAPSIMAGVAETRPPREKPKFVHAPAADEVTGLKLLPPPAPGASSGATASLGGPLPFGVPDCSGELVRISNYAAHLAEGVAASPNDDLLLFDAAGKPTGNLARALVNMAAVEIGPDRPRMALVTAAVSQLRRLLDDPTKAASAGSSPDPEKETPQNAAPGANDKAARKDDGAPPEPLTSPSGGRPARAD